MQQQKTSASWKQQLAWGATPLCLAIAVSFSWAPSAYAQREITLTEVIALTMQSSPILRSIDEDFAGRLAHAVEAEILQNPELGFIVKTPTSGGGTGAEAELIQPLRWSDFGSRRLYAAALREVASIEQEAALFYLVNQSTELYFQYWIAQEREKIAADAVFDVGRINRQIEQVRKRGDRPLSEFNLFGAEAERWVQEQKARRAEQAQLRSEIAVATGLIGQSLTARAPDLPKLPTGVDELIRFAQARGYGRKLAESSLAAAERRLQVARADRWPEVGPRLFYEREPGGGDTIGFGASLTLPLWDRNQAEIMRAQASVTSTRTHLRQLRQGNLEALVIGRHKQAALLAERAEAYTQKIAPAYRQNYQRFQTMFERGQVTLFDLWQAQQSVIEISDDVLAKQFEALQVRLALEQVIGGKLEEVGQND